MFDLFSHMVVETGPKSRWGLRRILGHLHLSRPSRTWTFDGVTDGLEIDGALDLSTVD